tara:strand:+ start:596 stop:760 length:165 start_codon:yes stop_codon:yes gene_type:complete
MKLRKIDKLKKKLLKAESFGEGLNKPNEVVLTKEIIKIVNKNKKKPIDTSNLIK